MKSSRRFVLIQDLAPRIRAVHPNEFDHLATTFQIPLVAKNGANGLTWIRRCLEGAHDSVLEDLAEHFGLLELPVESGSELPDEDGSHLWKSGHLRLFISHSDHQKRDAVELKDQLLRLGVSSFVAHQDIEPTKEWETEILTAMNSCHAALAYLTPDFAASKWCSQEIGYCFARGKEIVALTRGQDPFGFIGRFQAMKSNGKDALRSALELLSIFTNHSEFRNQAADGLIQALCGSPSWKQSRLVLDYIERCPALSMDQVETIEEAQDSNSEVGNSGGVPDRIAALRRRHADSWT